MREDRTREELLEQAQALLTVQKQVLEAVSERVQDVGELLLLQLARLGRELTPPGRIDPVEGVRDVLALHGFEC